MYNWRLLLLALFAVFQPIASFTERNLVDGRQECCDHRLERDSAYSLYGNSRLKQPSEDHRLTGLRIETRELSRDERRHQNVPLSRSLHRRSIELRSRAALTDPQQGRESQNRDGIVFAERAISREVLRNSRTDRIRIASRREYNLDRESNSRITRAILESHPVNSQRETRHVQASIDEIRRNRDNRETHELRRTRDSVARIERPTILNRRVENERSIELRQRHNERSVRSVDRISSDSNRFSLENSQERSSRTQSGENFRNENARSSIELRFRETQDTDRSTRRSTNGQQLKSTRDHRAVNRLDRRENEYKVRDVAERISLDQRAARDVYRKSEAARNYRSNEVDVLRDATNERVSRDRVTHETSQRRSVRDAERRVTRNDNRMSASMRRSEIRNTLSERQLNRQTSRMNDLQDRNNVRETERTDTINADRSKDNVLTRRIEIRAPANERNARESRERDTVESNRLSSRVSKRDISRVQRFVRNDERRDTRNEDRTRDNIAMRRIDTQIPKNERNVRLVRDRETSELNRMSPRMNEREIARERYNERDNERKETRNADLTREVSRDNMSTRRIAIRITNSRSDRRTRERTVSQPNRLTPRMNERETARDRYNVRDNERRETRDEDWSRDNIANMRRSDIRTSTNVGNERQDRERAASDSERLALRMNERHNVRHDKRRATRNVDRNREVSRDNASTRRNDIRSSANERLVRERAALDSERLSFRMNERHSVRDDERRVTRNPDRTREVSRDNASMRLSDIRSSTSERLVRERAASDSERLSFRMNKRHNVRDDERRVTRNVDRNREVSRDNASMRRNDIRSSTNERLVRERTASDFERLSFRANERDNVRDNERRATRIADRTREVSRDNASMRRTDIRSSTNERLVRDRATSDSDRLSFRMNERHNVRDDELTATRNTDRTRDMSRDSVSMRRSEIRSPTNEKLIRERAASDSERLSFRMNERQNVRNIERTATRNSDRTREVSRDITMRRVETRSGVESARSHVVTISDKNIETETQGYSWHYLIYTLQAIYLCSMLMPMTLNKDQNNKKIKNIGWWASLQSAIKID